MKIEAYVVNRILYTKDGSKTGNAIITRRMGGHYEVTTDYGNKATLGVGELQSQFTLGPMADMSHKYYVKQPHQELSWLRLVDFIRQETGEDAPLSSEDAERMIWKALDDYMKYQVPPSAPPKKAPTRIEVTGGPWNYRL